MLPERQESVEAALNRLTVQRLVFVLLSCVVSGCASLGSLAELRGRSVLLLVEGEAPAEAAEREAELTRELALVPLRIYPGDEDPDLQASLAAAEDRIGRAREAAEVRRAPWLLTQRGDRIVLETTRGGRVLWSSRRGVAPAARRKLIRNLSRALGQEDGPIPPDSTRLAPLEKLRELRRLALLADWEAHAAAAAELVTTFPADPAVRSHAGLMQQLAGERSGEDELVLAGAMAPDSESELLALALRAEGAGKVALALRLRQALTEIFPGRIDYIPRLAELHAALGQESRSLTLCRDGEVPGGGSDGTALPSPVSPMIPKGSAPDLFPHALPRADLRFCTGWYLFERGDWEFAALSYEAAADVFEALGRWDELAESLNNGGAAMVQAGRPLSGASRLRKAVDAREVLGAIGPLAVSRYNLGMALVQAGGYEEAAKSFGASAADYRSLGQMRSAWDAELQRLAPLAALGSGEEVEAQADQLQAALAEDGDLAASLMEGDAAEERLEELRGEFWFELGAARYALGEHEGSLAAYLRALRAWQTLRRRTLEGQTHYAMAAPRMATNRFDEAYADLLRALRVAVERSDSSSMIAIGQQLRSVEALIDDAGQHLPVVPEDLREALERLRMLDK